MSVWSPMILIADLFAPTVPSEPKPQNLHSVKPGVSTSTPSARSKDKNVTSSLIPNVKNFLPFSAAKLSNTATISAGITSLELKP